MTVVPAQRRGEVVQMEQLETRKHLAGDLEADLEAEARGAQTAGVS